MLTTVFNISWTVTTSYIPCIVVLIIVVVSGSSMKGGGELPDWAWVPACVHVYRVSMNQPDALLHVCILSYYIYCVCVCDVQLEIGELLYVYASSSIT